MNIEILKEKKEYVPKILMAGAVIFGFLILAKTASVFGELTRFKQTVDKVSQETKDETKKPEEYLKASKAITEELKKKNVFAPPMPSQKPSVEDVSGIFGDEVLIKGKWYKTGDKIGDAEILAIEPTLVRIMIDGKEKSFSPIATKAAGERGPETQEASSQQSSQRSDRSGRGGDRGFGGDRGGFRPSPEDIERYRNMTEEQRRALREEMIQRFRESRR